MAGSGWHGQTLRHSNARRLGKAGGIYSSIQKYKTLSRLRGFPALKQPYKLTNNEIFIRTYDKNHSSHDIVLSIDKKKGMAGETYHRVRWTDNSQMGRNQPEFQGSKRDAERIMKYWASKLAENPDYETWEHFFPRWKYS